MTVLPRYVLGVDPGKKTGICLLDLMKEDCPGVEVPFDELGYVLEDYISRYRPAVAIEAFVINAATVKNTQAPWSLEGIGITRYLAHKYDCMFAKQAQSSAKRFATNERLQALGWYVPGKGHLADGQRQALLFAVAHGWWHELL